MNYSTPLHTHIHISFFSYLRFRGTNVYDRTERTELARTLLLSLAEIEKTAFRHFNELSGKRKNHSVTRACMHACMRVDRDSLREIIQLPHGRRAVRGIVGRRVLLRALARCVP